MERQQKGNENRNKVTRTRNMNINRRMKYTHPLILFQEEKTGMGKKKNELSVMYLSFRKIYYLKHPLKFFWEIYWNIRNFIHRGKYGYSYIDAWNWFYWWPTAGAEALRYIAEHGCGYPGHEPWETPEKWKAYLFDLADRMDACVKSIDNFDSEDPQGDERKCIETFSEIGKNLGRFWD